MTCEWQEEDNRSTRLQQISIGTSRLTHIAVAAIYAAAANTPRKMARDNLLGLQARGTPTVSSDQICFDKTSTALTMRSLQGTFALRTYSRDSSEGIPKQPNGS